MGTAVIVAGGLGTRMAAQYPDTPKCLVPVAGKPIIFRQVEGLRASGYDDIIVTVGYLGRKVRDALGDGSGLGVTIRYVEEEEPLGTGGALHFLRDRVVEDFIVVLGDIVFDADLRRVADFHRDRQASVTLVVHPNDHPQDSDIVVTDPDDNVTGWISKKAGRPALFPNRVNSGLYAFSPSVLRDLDAPRRLDLDRDIVVPRIPDGGVKAYRTTEYIKDAGTPDRCAQVSAAIDAGLVVCRNLEKPQRAVFLDRDGTLNAHRGLIHRPEDLELEAGVSSAVRRLNQSPFIAICITNQSVIARNLCSLDELQSLHWKLDVLLGREGAYLEDLFFCPHHPDRGYPEERREFKIRCHCRKPDVGLVKEAADRYNIDLARSWFVGDTTVDIQTGHNAGTRTILVRTGVAGADGKHTARPDHRVLGLQAAVDLILDVEEGS